MNQEILSQLNDPDPKVRRLATKELRSVVDPNVRSIWLTKIADADDIVRRNAVIGLGNWEGEETANLILPLLSDTSLEVRLSVIDVLCKVKLRSQNILDGLRHHYLKVRRNRTGRKRGEEEREFDFLENRLVKIDPNLNTWLEEQDAKQREQLYLNRLELMKRRIEQTDILEKEATSSLLKGLFTNSLKDLGAVYFDRYILPYLLVNVYEIRFLRHKSIQGGLGISMDMTFDSWIKVANALDLRFNATGAEPIINSLCSAVLNDMNDDNEFLRYKCVQVLRGLKDERSIPTLKIIAARYPHTTDDEGEEARDAVSEILAATRTAFLIRTTSESFGKLAFEFRNKK